MSRSRPAAAETVRAMVRAAGLRCTAARLAVMEHLVAARGPQTHAEVSESLADRGFDRATIYRNLTELTEAKLLARVELGDHVWRFEAKPPRGAGGEDHPHFVCIACGEVSCLEDVNVAITPRPRRRATGRAPRQRDGRREGRPGIHSVTEVLLKGRCGECG